MSDTSTAPVSTETAPSGADEQFAEQTTQSEGFSIREHDEAAVSIDQPQATEWWNELPNDMRDHSVFRKYRTPNDALLGLVEAQKLIGQKQVVSGLVKPVDGASEQDLLKYQNALYQEHLGVPEDPDKYHIGEDYNAEVLKPLAKIAHKAKMGGEQWNEFVNGLAEYDAQQADLYKQQTAELHAQNVEVLKKEWGPSFGDNIAKANLGLEALSNIDGLTEFVTSDQIRTNPVLLKAFMKVGEMVQEGGYKGGDASRNEPVQTARDYLRENYEKIVNNPSLDAGKSRKEYARLQAREQESNG